MEEEVTNRTVNLAISTTKLTGRAILTAFRKEKITQQFKFQFVDL